MNEVLAIVGQDSRDSARVPVHVLVERLENEREELHQKKKQLELQLSEIEDWRRRQTSNILMRRLDKTRSIEATTRLEAEAREKKAPFVSEMHTIEKRIHDIKTTLANKKPKEELAPISLRIEDLLTKISERLNCG